MKRILLAVTLVLLIGVSMSLHDIDKNSSNRITPILNAADSVTERKAHGTNSVQNTNDLEEVDGLQFRERQIVAVQDGENKAAFGFYGTANKFGLKVAEDGVDVLTATDDQLVFNSEQNVFKIVLEGNVTLNAVFATVAGAGVGRDTNTVTVNHSLGYKPQIIAYMESTNSFYPLPYTVYGGTANNLTIQHVDCYVTSSTIVFTIQSNIIAIAVGGTVSGNVSWNIKYYLLQETAD